MPRRRRAPEAAAATAPRLDRSDSVTEVCPCGGADAEEPQPAGEAAAQAPQDGAETVSKDRGRNIGDPAGTPGFVPLAAPRRSRLARGSAMPSARPTGGRRAGV